MIPKTLKEFIPEVRDATDQHKVQWIQGDANGYFCSVKDVNLHIWYDVDEDRDRATITFRVTKNMKKTPFSVTDDEFDFPTMKNLWEAVLANANDVGDDVKGLFD